MNRILLLFFFIPFFALAQVPQGVGYQGVATDANGIELVNQSISIRASVLSSSANGTIEWQETHTTTTDAFGLFTLTIGQGTNTTNGAQSSFADISWGTNTHFLKIEMDVTGGSNYSFMGTNQMMSVPYALYAENANINYDSISNILSNDSTFITTVGGGIGGGGCDYSFPEGLDGEIITQMITKPSNYTVPNGKTLYITNYYSETQDLEIIVSGNDGRPIIERYVGGQTYGLVNPIILRSNDIIQSQSTGVQNYFNGILIDSKPEVEPLSLEITSLNTYTVPNGKIYVITNAYNILATELRINATQTMRTHKYLRQHIFAKSGDIIDVTSGKYILNGYLVDENYFAGCGGGSSSTIPSGGTPGSVLIIDINGNPTWSNTYLSVGDNWAGGIIAYIFEPGDPGYIAGETHGYVVHPLHSGDFPQNQGFAMGWGCDGVVTGINNSNLGEGYNNTALIASQCPTGTGGVWTNTISHAKFWNDLNDGGYNDWFMPNSAEVPKLDPLVLPTSGGFYISEEVIQGECNYCDPAYVARSWYFGQNTPPQGQLDFTNKNAGTLSIGIREF